MEHDLALALGLPSLSFIKSWTEQEFQRWRLYAVRYQLPQRRLELGLALLTRHVALGLGTMEECAIEDFLFDPPPQEETTGDQLEDAKRFFDFKPING